MVRRAETAVAAGNDAALGAVDDKLCRPGRGDIIKRSGAVLRLRIGLAQKRHQLGDLFAPDGILRAEAAIGVAGDQTEVAEHPHSVDVFDFLLVGKTCKFSRSARDHERKRQHSRKQYAKQFFQGGAPFHVYL